VLLEVEFDSTEPGLPRSTSLSLPVTEKIETSQHILLATIIIIIIIYSDHLMNQTPRDSRC